MTHRSFMVWCPRLENFSLMCYNIHVILKEGASIETSDQKLRIVPHWAFHCINGRSSIGKSRSGNIPGCICSVFSYPCQSHIDIRMVAEYVECAADRCADCTAA